MPSSIDYSIESAPFPEGTKLIVLSGEIDESKEKEFIDMFEKLFKMEENSFILKLNNLTYISSKIIGVILLWHGRFKSAGKEFVFAEVAEPAMDIINVVGLASVVDIFPSVEEACIYFEK